MLKMTRLSIIVIPYSVHVTSSSIIMGNWRRLSRYPCVLKHHRMLLYAELQVMVSFATFVFVLREHTELDRVSALGSWQICSFSPCLSFVENVCVKDTSPTHKLLLSF